MVKVQEGTNEQKFITIPAELARAMGIEKGDQMEWEVKDADTLVLSTR